MKCCAMCCYVKGYMMSGDKGSNVLIHRRAHRNALTNALNHYKWIDSPTLWPNSLMLGISGKWNSGQWLVLAHKSPSSFP